MKEIFSVHFMTGGEFWRLIASGLPKGFVDYVDLSFLAELTSHTKRLPPPALSRSFLVLVTLASLGCHYRTVCIIISNFIYTYTFHWKNFGLPIKMSIFL